MPSPTPEQLEVTDEALSNLDQAIAAGNLHPILKPVLLLMQNDDGNWWPDQMPMERVTTIKELLEAAHAEKTINKALFDLLRASTVIHKKPGAQTVGLHLMALCENCIVEKNLLAQFKRDAEFAPGDLDKAKDMVGAKPTAQPAKVGDKPPEGSLRVDQITPGGKRRL